MSGIGRGAGEGSMHDRATLRGAKSGRPNRRRASASSALDGIWSSFGRAAWVGRAALVLVGFGVLLIALMAAWQLATTAPELAVEKVEVMGTHRATAESITRLSGIQVGENILRLDTAAIERTIAAHPWVAKATVSRKMPRTVHIVIVEHEPVVLVALGHLYYANRAGEVVKRYTPGEREMLPVITGLEREAVEADNGEARERIVSAVAFLDELASVMGNDAPGIAEIHLDPLLGLSFVARNEDLSVSLGHPPWRRGIERLVEVKRSLEAKGVKASRIVVGGDRRPDRAVARLSSRIVEDGGRKDRQAVSSAALE